MIRNNFYNKVKTLIPNIIQLPVHVLSMNWWTSQIILSTYNSLNISFQLVVAAVGKWAQLFFSRYFGIQFYGECWGDVEGEARYAMHGEVDRKHSEQNCIEGEI